MLYGSGTVNNNDVTMETRSQQHERASAHSCVSSQLMFTIHARCYTCIYSNSTCHVHALLASRVGDMHTFMYNVESIMSYQ